MKLPQNDAPLPQVVIDLTSESGVWEPPAVIEIASDAEPVDEESESEDEEDEGEVYYSNPAPVGDMGVSDYDDDEGDRESEVDVVVQEVVATVPETQFPEKKQPIAQPEAVKVLRPITLNIPTPPLRSC